VTVKRSKRSKSRAFRHHIAREAGKRERAAGLYLDEIYREALASDPKAAAWLRSQRLNDGSSNRQPNAGDKGQGWCR